MVNERDVPNATPIADETVRQQVTQLFGESLFGGWPELEQHVVKPRRRRRFRPWLYRFLVIGVVAGTVWGGQHLMKPGLKRQIDDHRGNYADELQSFLNDGDLGRAAQFLPLVRDGVPSADPNAPKPVLRQDIDPKDPHLDLIVGTEATLYRYFDADPKRLRRIESHLEGAGAAAPLRLIARFTVLSREERASRLTEIEQLHNDQPNRNELEYLMATALEFKKDAKAAREAWARSERLGPAWLGHRFEQALFELHQNRDAAAQKIARQILRVDPESVWSKLAVTTFDLPSSDLQKAVGQQSVPADAATPVVSPVQIHFERLQQAINTGRRGDLGAAKQQLTAAAEAIKNEPPFLFDAFDWLVEEKLLVLARQLTELSAWPRGSQVAAAKVARLGDKR